MVEVRYTSWTDAQATGTATVMATTSPPTGRGATTSRTPAAFVLDKVVESPDGPWFARTTVHYTGADPYGAATEEFPLGPVTP